jgi:fibronectin-binding autotransporter adhesin
MRRSWIQLATCVLLACVFLSALLWLLGAAAGEVLALNGPNGPADLRGRATTSLLTATRYVAISGVDESDCSNPAFPCRTMQYAVDVAQPGDAVLVAAGTYTGVQPRPAPVGYPGPSVVTQVLYLSGTLTLRGGYTTSNSYAGPPDPILYPTVLDAAGRGRVVFITGEVSPTLENLELTGGDATGLGGDSFERDAGGGLYLAAGGLVRDVRIWGNTAGPAGSGGGLYLKRSDARLAENIIRENSAGLQGGGGYLWFSPAQLAGNEIHANSVITFGGGLSLVGSPVTLDHNRLFTNVARYGGALYLDTSDATFTENLVMDNEAWVGGGLYLSYAGWVSPSTLVSNTFASNQALLGGGIWMIYAPSTLAGNAIISNTAVDGGGLAMFSSETRFVRNQFAGNNAADEGGALRVEYSNARFEGNQIEHNTADSGGGLWLGGSAAVLTANVVISNSAHLGGGLYLLDSHALLNNDVIASNQAVELGAGLLISDSAPVLRHATVAGNLGGDGSGVLVTARDGASSQVVLTNTILVGHRVGISVAAGCTATLEATLWGSGPWANTTDWAGPGRIVTGTINLWVDPAFLDPGRGDLHLTASSGAVDAGIDAGLRTDLDGEVRPAGAGFDIGADEFVATAVSQLYLPVVLR